MAWLKRIGLMVLTTTIFTFGIPLLFPMLAAWTTRYSTDVLAFFAVPRLGDTAIARKENVIGPKPFVMVDVDEVSLASWGYPRLTPSNQILDIAEVARKAGAMLVIVDFDIRTIAFAEGETAAKQIGDRIARWKKDDTASPTILAYVPRVPAAPRAEKPRPALDVQFDALDDQISTQLPLGSDGTKIPSVLWGSVDLLFRIEDGVFEKIAWFIGVCVLPAGPSPDKLQGFATVIPSVPLIAAAVASRNLPALKATKFHKAAPDCAKKSLMHEELKIDLDNQAIMLTEHRSFNPIRYRILPNRMSRSDIPLLGPGVFLFEPWSAKEALEQWTSKDANVAAFVKDRIVIIGSSVGSDNYLTAVGNLPGFHIIANAIDSFFVNGTIKKAFG